jgi:hypothetical protein
MLSGWLPAASLWLLLLATPLTSLPGQSAEIEVRPAQVTVSTGGQAQFRAVLPEGARGDHPVVWSTMPSDAASIDAEGVLYAHRPGIVRVIARRNGALGIAEAQIEPPPATTVEIHLDQGEIVVDGSTILRATAYSADGDPLGAALFTYQSGDERVAVVTPSGVVTGRREGTAILAATSGGARTEVRIRVIRNRVAVLSVSGPTHTRTGEVVRLRVIAEDERRLPVAEPVVQWSVAGRGASIDQDGGFVAEESGTFLITVSIGSVAGTHAIRVDPRPLSRSLIMVGHREWGGEGGRGRGGGRGGGGVARGGHAKDGLVYVVMGTNRISTFDISDPVHPRLVDSLALDATAVYDIALEDDGQFGVVTWKGLSPVQGGLSVLDFTDPRHPRLRATLDASIVGEVQGVVIDGRHAYAAAARTGRLQVIDLTDPGAPRLVGSWTWADAAEPGDVAPEFRGHSIRQVRVLNGLAFLAAGREGLVILDVGNGVRAGSPESPRLVSRLAYDVAADYPAGMRAGTYAVHPAGSRVYLADGAFPEGVNPEDQTRGVLGGLGRVRVVDLSDPVHPHQVADYHLAGMGARSLWLDGDVLYVGFEGGGLRAVDVGGDLRGNLLAQGREIGTLWTGSPTGFRANLSFVNDVQPQGDLVVAFDAYGGLWLARLTGVKSR